MSLTMSSEANTQPDEDSHARFKGNRATDNVDRNGLSFALYVGSQHRGERQWGIGTGDGS
jgi:hypothetical protein